MIPIPIYISTCDKTKDVLKANFLLMEKYWPVKKNVTVLGYSGDNISLPDNYSFLSMFPSQNSIDSWAMDIYATLNQTTEEYLIFMLDDMLMIDYFDVDLFNVLLEKMKHDKSIVRVDLGMDLQRMPCKIIGQYSGALFVEKLHTANYWHTTQPSIWRTDYFLSILKKSTNPWNFETKHSVQKGIREIGTRNKYVAKSLIDTAISQNHPGKFNVLGLRCEDIDMLINEDAVELDDLQYGIRKGIVPKYNKDTPFTFDILKGTKDINGIDMYNYHKNLYESQYE